MIHLDTNYLVELVGTPTPMEAEIARWLEAGESLAVSAVAWSEFLNGPVTPEQVEAASGIVLGNIVPFGEREAEVASRLFNRAGRKRGSRPDCFIAATAICAAAPLATRNRKHFLPFIPVGLRFA